MEKLKCGHTPEEHRAFGRLTPEEQEIIQLQYDCEMDA